MWNISVCKNATLIVDVVRYSASLLRKIHEILLLNQRSLKDSAISHF